MINTLVSYTTSAVHQMTLTKTRVKSTGHSTHQGVPKCLGTSKWKI